MNSSEFHCLGTFWTDREITVIDALAKKQELSPMAVLRQALRNYQLAVEGTPDVGKLAEPNSAVPPAQVNKHQKFRDKIRNGEFDPEGQGAEKK